jgi:hypothetical protein
MWFISVISWRYLQKGHHNTQTILSILSIGLSSEINGTLALRVTRHLNQYMVTSHEIESVYAFYVSRSVNDFQMMHYPTV